MKQILRNLVLTASITGLAAGNLGYGQSAAQQVLIEKARTLETRGRIDMAAQTWQQVLLSDPNNSDALAGLARCAKLNGKDAEAAAYVERLRKANPTDPNIARVQGLSSTKVQNAQLEQASKLAQQGQSEQALKLYRSVFGTRPPDGDWALAYYDTEAATEANRADAIANLRELQKKYPSDTRYAVTLGRILTYGPKTRPEGERLLRQYPNDAGAQAALRQALNWDAQNPNSAPEIRAYLKTHQDEELSQKLKDSEEKQRKDDSGLAASAEERAAYQALQANHVDDAEQRFQAIQSAQPNNPRALAGLGYVRMKQGNFAAAVTYLEQAQQNGLRVPSVQSALATSRFWATMNEGTTALNNNQMDTAIARYQAALQMKPGSPDALAGLAGTYMRQQRPADAIAVYQRIIKTQPAAAAGWRGLFLAQSQAGNGREALATAQRFPPAVKTSLASDPEYLRALASTYSSLGQEAQARQVLSQALNLPFPEDGKNMKADTRLQYAGLLMQGKLYNQAAGLYSDILSADAGNVAAWQGLVNAEHLMNLDADAVATVERMPPATYDRALEDPGFLSTLAAVYQQQNQLDLASGFLERAAKIQTTSGGEASVPLQLQLAALYLQRNNPGQAYSIYRRVLMAHPDRLDGWKGLMSALHQTGHDQEALAQVSQIPADVRKSLNADPQFQQTLAAVYASSGNAQAALVELNKIQNHYAAQRIAVPADVDIQSAWLLFNAKSDRALYPTLMRLGGRTDLTDEQRRQIQNIWASWSVRRATQAADQGNSRKALGILNAAAQTFPGNPSVSKALAGGYLRAGEPKAALEIFQSLDLSNAPVADYQGAIAAALAAQNMRQAEDWLRESLQLYPDDPQILSSAARFEQARGDQARAAAYWRAALRVMPKQAPGSDLAEALGTPDAPRRQRSPQSTNLASLLNPDAEATAQRGAQAIPLPSYNAPADPSAPPADSGYPSGSYSPAPNAAYPSAPTAGEAMPYDSGDTSVVPVPLRTAPQQNAAPATAPLPMPAAKPARRRSKAPASSATPTAPSGTGRLGDYRPQHSVLNPPDMPSDGALPEQADASWPAAPQDDAPAAQAQVNIPSVDELLGASPASAGSEAPTEAFADASPQSAAPLPLSDAPRQTSSQQVTLLDPESGQIVPLRHHRAPRPLPLPGEARPATVHTGDSRDAELAQALPPLTSGNALRTPTRQALPVPVESPRTQGDIAELSPYDAPQIRYTPASHRVTIDTTHEALAAAVRPVEPMQLSQYAPPEQQAPFARTPRNDGAYAPGPPAPSTRFGAGDENLIDRNLPPLRGGAMVRPRSAEQNDPRREAQIQLARIEGGSSPWIGETGMVMARSGAAGFDKLTTLEAPFEHSVGIGNVARFSVVARPSFLDAGIADGTSTNRLGSLPATALPTQQLASGVGGEFQLTTANFGASVGYTPYGFLVSNIIGRVSVHPASGPVTVTFSRDAIKDTQLSYAGLRDPGSASRTYDGNIWGGVIANSGQIAFTRGDSHSGLYVQGGGQYLTGHHVQNNTRIDGDAGAYWRVLDLPEYGSLSLGVNIFGMHYANNLRYFTYGQGGYFSPEAYMLLNVPVSWTGHNGTNFHYTIAGSMGGQAFQEQSSAFFPLDTALQAANGNQKYPARTSVGGNYDLHGEGAYRVADHWYVGGFLAANNSRDYNNVNAGFFVRYLFRPQFPTDAGPTGLFPYEGLRPLLVP